MVQFFFKRLFRTKTFYIALGIGTVISLANFFIDIFPNRYYGNTPYTIWLESFSPSRLPQIYFQIFPILAVLPMASIYFKDGTGKNKMKIVWLKGYGKFFLLYLIGVAIFVSYSHTEPALTVLCNGAFLSKIVAAGPILLMGWVLYSTVQLFLREAVIVKNKNIEIITKTIIQRLALYSVSIALVYSGVSFLIVFLCTHNIVFPKEDQIYNVDIGATFIRIFMVLSCYLFWIVLLGLLLYLIWKKVIVSIIAMLMIPFLGEQLNFVLVNRFLCSMLTPDTKFLCSDVYSMFLGMSRSLLMAFVFYCIITLSLIHI